MQDVLSALGKQATLKEVNKTMSNNESSLAHDFTKACNSTLRPSRIIVLSLGLLIGVAAAILFFWLGGLIKPQGLRWLSWVIQRIGAVIFAYTTLASLSAVVAMAHAESNGERIGVPAGWAMIVRNLGPVVFGTLKPIVVFVGLVAVIWLVGAIGAIPEVGPIIWGIASVVPVAAGLLATFVLAKLVLVSFVFPAVLSVNKEKGVATYKESVRMIKAHAARYVGRLALVILVCFVFYQVLLAGFSVTAAHSARTMGNNRLTLRGSQLFDYVAGVPGVSGTALRGFSVDNPTGPFVQKAWGLPAEAGRMFFGVETPRLKATQKVGGWIFSLELLVLSAILFSLPLLFFSLSGYNTYLSLQGKPEIPLKTEAVDWSEIKETAHEIAGKRKSEPAEKPAKGSSA
jgi:hypothetical protein